MFSEFNSPMGKRAFKVAAAKANDTNDVALWTSLFEKSLESIDVCCLVKILLDEMPTAIVGNDKVVKHLAMKVLKKDPAFFAPFFATLACEGYVDEKLLAEALSLRRWDIAKSVLHRAFNHINVNAWELTQVSSTFNEEESRKWGEIKAAYQSLENLVI